MAIVSKINNANQPTRFRGLLNLGGLMLDGGRALVAGAAALTLVFTVPGMAHASTLANAAGVVTVNANANAAVATDSDEGGLAAADADAQFRTLFQTWKKADTIEQTVISVPSMQPVNRVTFTSHFGVRSDPFRGTAAMHAGVDIPGAIGTPIYATADGIVSHAGLQGGYGNLIQINHGRGIETRYGHLSKILVADNTRVRRGQLIGLMGSTGRSTGSHLHYEVRVDGKAVNPIPFLQTGEYVAGVQNEVPGGMGGGGK